ncbi:unannotated protein [freshwater metagenome]|uniref:Unannotated protein n=1 Tax=freshwater metagenome TaxID=449393 RepID=A0A6J7DP09_9ZZZZ
MSARSRVAQSHTALPFDTPLARPDGPSSTPGASRWASAASSGARSPSEASSSTERAASCSTIAASGRNRSAKNHAQLVNEARVACWLARSTEASCCEARGRTFRATNSSQRDRSASTSPYSSRACHGSTNTSAPRRAYTSFACLLSTSSSERSGPRQRWCESAEPSVEQPQSERHRSYPCAHDHALGSSEPTSARATPVMRASSPPACIIRSATTSYRRCPTARSEKRW